MQPCKTTGDDDDNNDNDFEIFHISELSNIEVKF